MIRWPAVSLALSLATLALVAVSPGAAQAQTTKTQTIKPLRPVKPMAKPLSAYEKCLASPAGQTTMGMIDCADAELQSQDARLNRAYQTALGRLERPRQKAALQKAQRAWIAFRDADCASYYDEDWGSMARVQANVCVLDHTIRRAKDLEDYRREF